MRRISVTGNAGFTLLELMLVVLLMGLLAVTVSLALPDSAQQHLNADGKRLRALVELAGEQAIYQNRDYGLLFSDSSYRFYQREGESWVAVPKASRLQVRPLQADTQLSLMLGGQTVDLSEPTAPQVLILNDGQITPFELVLRHPDAAREVTLSVASGGETRLQDLTR